MSCDPAPPLAISVAGLSKCYTIFHRPADRLWQMLLRGAKKLYSEFWALSDVSLEVGRGETVAILGRNGAGKSTLLQILAGTLQPTAGEVRVEGRIAALLELGAGFNPEFTGRENVRLAASVLGLSRAEIAAREGDILAFAALGDFIDQPVSLYSSGMYARLAFAVAAHVDADILMVDEALSVGDAAFRQKCMRFLRQFKQTGTLIFVTHDTGSALALCDRAIWLEAGRVRQSGPVDAVVEAYLADAYAGNDETGRFTIGGTRTARPPLPTEPVAPTGMAEGQVFDFDPDGAHFGIGGGVIEKVALLGAENQPIELLRGGEPVTLVITARALEALTSPILGFFVKDRTGQVLFGENSWQDGRHAALELARGARIEARFRFDMPLLPAGDYAITAAFATGLPEAHDQRQWRHDALFFRIHTSSVARGLVGIPMRGIELLTP